MCGRYALHARPEVIALQFGVPPPGRFAPRYNVAPGTLILVVADGAERRLENWHWGREGAARAAPDGGRHSP